MKTLFTLTVAAALLVVTSETPTVFAPGVISDEHEQWRITFTPDAKTAYFAESEGFFPMTRKATIWVSHLEKGEWSQPTLAPFSGTYTDMDPFISPDGRRLYFSSIRPVAGAMRGDLDLWYVERTATGWGEPVRLDDGINTPSDELYASASADGTLYFARGPQAPAAGKHWDIYRARRNGNAFDAGEPLSAAVNTVPAASDPHLQSAWEFNPEISADGKTLLFTSLRPGIGFGDLYVSHLNGKEWTPAKNLGPTVNTAADEYHPTLSPDGRSLFFVRRVSKRGDFYIIPTSAVPALSR